MTNSERCDFVDDMIKAMERMKCALEGYACDDDAKPFFKILNKLITETQILTDKVDDDI